jgi:hypothetical protein
MAERAKLDGVAWIGRGVRPSVAIGRYQHTEIAVAAQFQSIPEKTRLRHGQGSGRAPAGKRRPVRWACPIHSTRPDPRRNHP